MQLMSRPHYWRATIRLALVSLLALPLVCCGSAGQRAESYYQNGMKLLAAHENEKAAIEFRNALQLNNDLLPAWRGLAQAEQATQHWQALVPVLRTIIRLDPGDEKARVKLAALLLTGGAVDQALKLANEAGDKDANDPELLALKAIIFARLKNNVAAERAAEAALKIAPDNLDALKVLAGDRLANGDPNGALKLLTGDFPALKADVGVQLIKIKIYEQLGDLTREEAILRKLTELYPHEILFRKQLIKFYLDQHRPDDAQNELRAIIAADPSNSEAALDLIQLLYTAKSPAAAHAEIIARINAGGDVFPYQMALAEFDYNQGNDIASFDLLRSLIRDATSPQNALAAKMKLAELNLSRKNLDVAEMLVGEILRDDSLSGLRLHAAALKLRATIRLERDQTEAAISDLLEALNAQPRSVDLMLLLSAAYERTGAMELAEKELGEAFRVSNFDPAVGLSYAGFLQRRSESKRAEDVLSDLAIRYPGNVAVLSMLADVKMSHQDWAGAQQIGETIRRLGGSNGIADQIIGEVAEWPTKIRCEYCGVAKRSGGGAVGSSANGHSGAGLFGCQGNG